MPNASRLWPPVAGGAVAGLALGDLLLGLNPHLVAPLATARLLAVNAAAGALLASPLVLRRAPRATARVRGCLLAAALLGAFALFVEAQRIRDYHLLAPGARRTLVATALAASAGAVLAVGAALLRALRPRDLVGPLVLLFLLPPFFGKRSREPGVLTSPAPLPRSGTSSLLVIGFDGLSWEVVSALASDGSMPVFARLLAGGAGGPLGSPTPYDRAALWTSAATGKRPYKHAVVSSWVWNTAGGALRLLPHVPGGGSPDRVLFASAHPVAGGERRSLDFWEILAARGHAVAVLNWPASSPARDGLVLWASDQAFAGELAPEDAVRPAASAPLAHLFRVDVGHLDRPLSRALVPEGLGSPDDRRVLLEAAARDLTVTGTALATVPSGAGSVSTLVLSGAAGVSRRFGAAADARYWGVSAPDAEARARARTAYYRFLDDVLGELTEREGRERTLCVFSPVGYGPPPPLDALGSFLSGREPAASPEGSRDGFLVLSGSGIRAGVRLTSAGVLDLAPTLLVLAGEPIARDMDGRVLAESFDERLAESASVPIVTTFEPGGPQ